MRQEACGWTEALQTTGGRNDVTECSQHINTAMHKAKCQGEEFKPHPPFPSMFSMFRNVLSRGRYLIM